MIEEKKFRLGKTMYSDVLKRDREAIFVSYYDVINT